MNKKSVIILTSAVLALGVSSVHGATLSSWTFNTGTTSTERLASSGTVSGLTVSQLVINDNHDDFGVGTVPSGDNDGFGFGGNSGEQNMFIHRANYFNPGAPEGERTTWGGPGAAGVDTTVLNSPISFSVATDASTSATIESLFFNGTPDGAPTILYFQEAGATAGSSVTANSASSYVATALLDAPIAIGPNQTIIFTLNVNSGGLDTKHIVNQLDLQGTTVIPEPSQAGLLIGAVGLLWVGIRRRRA